MNGVVTSAGDVQNFRDVAWQLEALRNRVFFLRLAIGMLRDRAASLWKHEILVLGWHFARHPIGQHAGDHRLDNETSEDISRSAGETGLRDVLQLFDATDILRP